LEYSIVIFDDEPLILEGLTKKVDWGALNCKVIGAALNGIDGKKIMETLHPDIVISDIMMPGLTGMDLAEYNYYHKCASKFIILTAYSDFSFAQKAVRYQVEDYILKPIEFKKLIAAVEHAIQKIQEERGREEKVQRLEAGLKSRQEHVTASLLFNVARYSEEAVKEDWDFFNEYMLFQQGVFLCVKLYNLKKAADTSIMGRIQSEIVRRFQQNGVSILRGSADDKLIFLCQIDLNVDIYTARQRLIALADRVTKEIGEEEDIICTCMVSEAYRTKEELNNRYKESILQLQESFFTNCSGVLEPVVKTEEPLGINLEPLLHHLKYGNRMDMEKEYQKLCRLLRSNQDTDYATHYLKELRHHAARAASEAGMAQKPGMEQPYTSMNFRELSIMIGKYLEAICVYIDRGQNLMGKVKLMVEEQYGDCCFGLAQAADCLGINSSYLSRLFKKEMNENFIDYLIDIRIEKAVYLLETTKLKNSEIACKVGFEDERYFGKVFKKKCGMTPKQYRDDKSRKIP
jgi:two-component system response regulator YesN